MKIRREMLNVHRECNVYEHIIIWANKALIDFLAFNLHITREKTGQSNTRWRTIKATAAIVRSKRKVRIWYKEHIII